jgi:transposase
MAILTVGIDLAKNVFAVHGVNDAGKPELLLLRLPRARLLEVVATLPPCLIDVEACSGAHHWARLFEAHGHTVRLMAPKLVTPYRMSGKRAKNDAADAAAICEAVQRPNIRFVPVMTEEQQSAVRRLAGPGAGAVQLGRQDAAGAHRQGGRRLPAQPAGAGGQGGCSMPV